MDTGGCERAMCDGFMVINSHCCKRRKNNNNEKGFTSFTSFELNCEVFEDFQFQFNYYSSLKSSLPMTGSFDVKIVFILFFTHLFLSAERNGIC